MISCDAFWGPDEDVYAALHGDPDWAHGYQNPSYEGAELPPLLTGGLPSVLTHRDSSVNEGRVPDH